MSKDTADLSSKMPRAILSITSRLLASGLVAGIGLVALVSSSASATLGPGPGTQIVLTASGPLLTGGPTTTLTATIENSSGQTVDTTADATANVTFSQINTAIDTGTVSGLGTFAAATGVANDVVSGQTVGNDAVEFQASAVLNGVTVTTTLAPPDQGTNFDASHGITVTKSCNGTTPVGHPLNCQYRIMNNVDTAHDTLSISSIVDQVFAYDGTVTSTNLLPSLSLNKTGTATCSVGQATCTLPYSTSITTNPSSFYTVAADDYKLSSHRLTDQVQIIWQDECDGGSGNCSTSQQTAQATSATTVTLDTPVVTTALTPPGPVTIGTSVQDQATLSGNSPTAGGTVSYAVFSNDTCTTQVASLGTKTVSNGTVGPSNSWTSTAGSYWFEATYSGDAGDIGPVSSVCASEPLTVANPAGIAITKLPAAQTVTPGGTASWTIVVTNNSSSTPLTNVSVVDALAPNCSRTFAGTLPPATSEPGYTCQLADVTTAFTNTANATGTPPSGPVVKASAQAVVIVLGFGTVVQLYADPPAEGGNDAGNNCLNITEPCATIAHALMEEALLAPDSVGSVINLSKGYFDDTSDLMFSALTPANSGVTVKGTTGVVVEPQTCSSLSTVAGGPDAGDQAIVTFNAGEEGITVENMTLSGSGVAGGACPTFTAGVIDTSGTTGDAVVGDMIQSGTTYGILTDDGADSLIISNRLSPVLCTATVKGPNTGLNAGWTSPANLSITALPKCAKLIESGHGAATGVFINGVAYCTTTSAAKKTLVITGTPTPVLGCTKGGTSIGNSGGVEISKGSTVFFNTATTSFTQFGIACNSPFQPEDQATDCAVSDNTVTGGGTVYGDLDPSCGGVPPVGILATGGATINVDGNTVSDVSDTINSCPEEGETTHDGIGIGFLPDDTLDGCSAGPSVIGVNDANFPKTGHGNTLGSTSPDDQGIVVSGNVGSTCSFADPAYQINGNTVSAANEVGILLTNLGFGNGHLSPGQPMENNSASGVAGGAGIELEGVHGQTIGGPFASQGNSSTGSGDGLLLEPCVPVVLHPLTPPGCVTYLGGTIFGGPEATQGNLIENNTMMSNVAFGVLAVGSYQPNEIAGTESTALESSGNTFNTNTWGTATSASNGTNSSEIDGAEVMDGTGWGGGCASIVGDCLSAGVGPLLFEGPNTIFSSTSPGTSTFTLSVCNAGTVSEDLPVGTEITFNTVQPNDGGTFFVTNAAIITGNAGCMGAFANLSLQAVAPADVGTLQSPTGQSYTLAKGDTVTVNANGSTSVPSANFYGSGPNSNSCTPAGTTSTPNVFGATDPPTIPFAYSKTLEASTGGVNATYSAC